MSLSDIVLTGLKAHIGKANAITAGEIVSRLRAKGHEINTTKLWQIVRDLRTENKIFICADGNGYYLPANESEKDHQINSLRSRAREIQETLEALEFIRANITQPELF